jgi:hypothetical protein
MRLAATEIVFDLALRSVCPPNASELPTFGRHAGLLH